MIGNNVYGGGTISGDKMPILTDISDYFDYKKNLTTSTWTNQIGTNNITFTGSNLIITNYGLIMNPNSYGSLYHPYSSNGVSVYAVLLINYDVITNRNNLVVGSVGSGTSNGRALTIATEGYNTNNSTFRTIQSDQFGIGMGSNVLAYDNYHVVCITRNTSGLNSLYIDGVLKNSFSNNVAYGDYWGLNCNMNYNNNVNIKSGCTTVFKMFAIANSCHSANDVLTNYNWLKKYYNN